MGRHRTLVIGAGSIGERHLRCWQQTGRTEMSFCEVNDDLREAISKRHNITKCFSDFGAALAECPDVAVVCTPANLHVSMATRLAEAGVHVLCEKPLSTSLKGVDKLIRTVADKGVTAATAYVLRCSPACEAVKAALAGNRFGKPVELVSVSGQNFPFFRPAYREIYFRDRATGGGAIQDAITHLLNLGEWLVSPIDRLAADADHLLLEGVEVEDTVHVITRQGAVMGSYAHNLHQAPNENVVTIMCERATVRINFTGQSWSWMARSGGDWHEEQVERVERDDMFIRQANMFLDAVEGKGSVRCTLAEGVQTLRVNLATLAAADGHTWQTVAG